MPRGPTPGLPASEHQPFAEPGEFYRRQNPGRPYRADLPTNGRCEAWCGLPDRKSTLSEGEAADGWLGVALLPTEGRHPVAAASRHYRKAVEGCEGVPLKEGTPAAYREQPVTNGAIWRIYSMTTEGRKWCISEHISTHEERRFSRYSSRKGLALFSKQGIILYSGHQTFRIIPNPGRASINVKLMTIIISFYTNHMQSFMTSAINCLYS